MMVLKKEKVKMPMEMSENHNDMFMSVLFDVK